MKKITYIALFVMLSVAFLSSCKSSGGTCPAYSDNGAQQTEQIAQR